MVMMMMMASWLWVRGEGRTAMDPGFRACFCAEDKSREMIKGIADNMNVPWLCTARCSLPREFW